jgi:hypothetical protein
VSSYSLEPSRGDRRAHQYVKVGSSVREPEVLDEASFEDNSEEEGKNVHDDEADDGYDRVDIITDRMSNATFDEL